MGMRGELDEQPARSRADGTVSTMFRSRSDQVRTQEDDGNGNQYHENMVVSKKWHQSLYANGEPHRSCHTELSLFLALVRAVSSPAAAGQPGGKDLSWNVTQSADECQRVCRVLVEWMLSVGSGIDVWFHNGIRRDGRRLQRSTLVTTVRSRYSSES